MKFYKAAEGAGIKPIAGADLLLADGDEAPTRLTVLCRDRDGYLSLSRLLSRAWMEGHRNDGVVVRPAVVAAKRTPACSPSPAATAKPDGSRSRASTNSPNNGSRNGNRHTGERLHLELTRTAREGEDAFNAFALHASSRRGMPVVATNDARFLDADGFDAHEARVCIATGRVLDDPKRPRDYSPEQYLKSSERDVGAVRRRPRCDRQRDRARHALQPRTAPGHVLPARLPGARRRNARQLDARAGARRPDASAWKKRRSPPATRARAISKRLEIELDVIIKMGFPGYFLIVADFINWAKDHGIPVGPGRGSGAGSLVAWALGITDLDPIPVRPAVRALPQSRTRVDARLRHRLLHGPPRRGDRLRRREVRPRPRQPDHHLRHDGGEGRGARHRPRARPSLRLRRQHRQADPADAGHEPRRRARRIRRRAQEPANSPRPN